MLRDLRAVIAVVVLLVTAIFLGPTLIEEPKPDEMEMLCRDMIRRMNDPRCEEFRDVH